MDPELELTIFERAGQLTQFDVNNAARALQSASLSDLDRLQEIIKFFEGSTLIDPPLNDQFQAAIDRLMDRALGWTTELTLPEHTLRASVGYALGLGDYDTHLARSDRLFRRLGQSGWGAQLLGLIARLRGMFDDVAAAFSSDYVAADRPLGPLRPGAEIAAFTDAGVHAGLVWAGVRVSLWHAAAIVALALETEREIPSGSDPGRSEEGRIAVEALSGEALAQTRARLEGPNADLERMLADETVSIPRDIEVQLRTAVDTINVQTRLDVGDRFTIERQVRLISELMIDLGDLDQQTICDVLTGLGAQPPGFVLDLAERVMGMIHALELIGEPNLSGQRTAERLESLEKKVDVALEFIRQMRPAESGIAERALVRWAKGLPQGIGQAAGRHLYDRAIRDTDFVRTVVNVVLRYASAVADLVGRYWTMLP
ncbi:MAG: hypothetical protein AAF567_24435 [Actinomycetota bacterium]